MFKVCEGTPPFWTVMLAKPLYKGIVSSMTQSKKMELTHFYVIPVYIYHKGLIIVVKVGILLIIVNDTTGIKFLWL